MVRRLCVVWLKSPLQDFVKSLTRLEPGLPSSYFADLCPGSKIGREGQVSCETLISNQRFKKPNISFPFSEDRALHIQESCSHKLGGGGWGVGGQTQRDWNGTFIGSCQALAAKLADLLISLWKLPREKGPQEIAALLLWQQHRAKWRRNLPIFEFCRRRLSGHLTRNWPPWWHLTSAKNGKKPISSLEDFIQRGALTTLAVSSKLSIHEARHVLCTRIDLFI